MVLVVNGVLQEDIPADSRSLYAAHPIYRETAAQLHSMPAKLVGPMGLLYVQQREMAATLPHDKNVSIIGSDDMTTCIIVVVRHSGSGAAALAHLDGAGTEDAATTMVQRVTELAIGFPEGRLELQLVGGYSDPRNYSEELFCNILSAFHKQPVEIDLTVCCVGELNTTVRGGIHWPVIYGIGLNVKTGEIFPATFPDKGPDQPLRSARQLTGGFGRVRLYPGAAPNRTLQLRSSARSRSLAGSVRSVYPATPLHCTGSRTAAFRVTGASNAQVYTGQSISGRHRLPRQQTSLLSSGRNHRCLATHTILILTVLILVDLCNEEKSKKSTKTVCEIAVLI